MVDLLLDTELDSEQRDYADSIRSSADALLTVINDVLDFSKIEAGKMQIDKQPFELSQMIRDIETMLSFMTAQKSLGLSVEQDEGFCYLYGDRGRVRQILTNLLSNAIKFTQKGSVSLTVKHEQETPEYVKIRFSITDTGTGMSEETVNNLFRPFAQGDAGRTYGGTGLGLSICKKLVHLMDGDIGSETELGVGSTFWFWLKFPRSSADAVKNRGSVRTSSRPSNDSSRNNSTMGPAPTIHTIMEASESAENLPKEVNDDDVTSDTAEISPEDNSDDRDEEDDDVYPPRIAIGQAFALPPRPTMSFDRSISTDSITTVRATNTIDEEDEYHNSDQEIPDIPEAEYQSMADIPRRASDDRSSEGTRSRKSSVVGFEAPARKFRGSLASSSTATTANFKDKRILLAEDNEINCKIATAMLRKLGYGCTVVKNGQEAVDAIDEQSAFDLVLMDVQMPVLNGYEATQLIRQSPNEPMRAIPVIALTASAVSGDREKCIQAGMDDYLTKPVNQKNLEKKLRKWLLLE